jgi:hypothetical protein
MSLLLDRNPEDGQYELKHLGITLARYEFLTDGYENALRSAKNTRQKLFVSAACISDWYVGFPKDATAMPEVFEERDPKVVEAKLQDYRFVEGPFDSSDTAKRAALLISGHSVP